MPSAIVYTIRGLSSSQGYAARTKLLRLVALVTQNYEWTSLESVKNARYSSIAIRTL